MAHDMRLFSGADLVRLHDAFYATDKFFPTDMTTAARIHIEQPRKQIAHQGIRRGLRRLHGLRAQNTTLHRQHGHQALKFIKQTRNRQPNVGECVTVFAGKTIRNQNLG